MSTLLAWCLSPRQNEKKSASINVKEKFEEEGLVCCSGCYGYIELKETDKKAKIKDRTVHFCDEDCYYEWLRNPSTMLL